MNRQRSGTSIDQLTYNYPFNTGTGYKLTDQSTNKLEFIDDAVTGNTDDIADQMGANYQYDASGNLFKDNSEGINGASGIQWTVDGKVRSVDYLGGDPSRIEIEYIYDASGNRVMKRVDREEDSGGENPHITKVHYDLYARDANSQVMAIYKRGVTHEEDEQDPTITDCLKLKFKPVFVVLGCTVELTICKDNMTFMPDGRSFKFNQPIDYTFPSTSPCAGSRFIIPANTVINYNPKNKSANGFFAGVWGYGMALNIDLPINIFGGGTETVSATLESVITISNISLMPKLAEWHIYGNDQQGRFVTRKPEAEPLYYLDNLTNDVKNKNFFRILDKKEYELKDHLGNVRVAIGDMKLPADPTATYPARGAGPFFVDEKAINDYYPYGMTISNRSWNTGDYRYGYGGHEQDNEVKGTAKHLDFGNYGYDPRIARRWNVDPMATSAPNWSPYRVFFNNPNFWTDPTGLQEFNDYNEYKDFAGNNALPALPSNEIGSQGHWLTSDRKDNTKVWDEANTFNIKNNVQNQYKPFEQVRDFYLWVENQALFLGHEVKWTRGASGLVGDLAKNLEGGSIFVGKDVQTLLSDLNIGIQNATLPYFKELLFGKTSHKPLKGNDAQLWDEALVNYEQGQVAPSIYSAAKKETVLKLNDMANQVSVSYYGLLGSIGGKTPPFYWFNATVSTTQARIDIPLLMMYPSTYRPKWSGFTDKVDNTGLLKQSWQKYFGKFLK